jgi:4-hydroxybenzoate polyprenyltransferase
MTIALLSALPVLEIYYFFKPLNVDNEFFAYALFAFLTTLLREIVKDKEDSNGDLKSGIKTLANTISDSKLKMVLLTVNSALLICLVGFLFFLNDFTMLTFWVYMVIMILPALLIFVLIYKLKNHTYSRLSLFIKVYMFLGLIRLWI